MVEHKYALLRGKEHNNVFWTPNVNIDPEKFETLFTGNDVDEMVGKWQEHNPELTNACYAARKNKTW